MVRAGIAIYGLDPSPAFAGRADIKPALSLKAKVSFVKEVPAGEGISYGLTYTTKQDSMIATLPLGYADGYSRLLSNKTDVLIKGLKAQNTGTICMDQFMVDVTDVPSVEPGAEAVLIGRSGSAVITAEDVAARLGTINYEVVCMISARVPRVYINVRRRAILGLVVISLLLTSCSRSGTNSNLLTSERRIMPNPNHSKSVFINDLRLEIATIKKEFPADEIIPLRISVTNTGDKTAAAYISVRTKIRLLGFRRRRNGTLAVVERENVFPSRDYDQT